MAKRNNTPKYATQEILREEISASEQRLSGRFDAKIGVLDTKVGALDIKIDNVEKRLDTKIGALDTKIDNVEKRLNSKIETTAQSLKDYTDSRFTQLDTRLVRLDNKTDALEAKMTKYFELMMQTFTNTDKKIDKIFVNHEQRITTLEARPR